MTKNKKEKRNLLNKYHCYINNSNIINGPGDVFGFIKKRFGVADIVAHLDAPQKKQKFANRQTMIPPIVFTDFKLQIIPIN